MAETKIAHHLERSKAVKELWSIVTDDRCKKMKERMSRKMREKNPATRLMKKHD